jgi:hypothetical protein
MSDKQDLAVVRPLPRQPRNHRATDIVDAGDGALAFASCAAVRFPWKAPLSHKRRANESNGGESDIRSGVYGWCCFGHRPVRGNIWFDTATLRHRISYERTNGLPRVKRKIVSGAALLPVPTIETGGMVFTAALIGGLWFALH